MIPCLVLHFGDCINKGFLLKNALRPVGEWLFNETQFYLIIICVYSVALLVISLATLITLLNLVKTIKNIQNKLSPNLSEIYQEML